jgi:hypothetical protein
MNIKINFFCNRELRSMILSEVPAAKVTGNPGRRTSFEGNIL